MGFLSDKSFGLKRLEAFLGSLKREISFRGSTMVGIGWKVENVTGAGGTTSLTINDNGTCYVVDATSGTQIFKLPTPTSGLRFRFVAADTSTNHIAATATSDGSTAANIAHGVFVVAGAAYTATTKDNFYLGYSTNAKTKGDWGECWCDGTNWYWTGVAHVANSLKLI